MITSGSPSAERLPAGQCKIHFLQNSGHRVLARPAAFSLLTVLPPIALLG